MTNKRKTAPAPGSKGKSMAISRKMSSPNVEITDVMKVRVVVVVDDECMRGIPFLVEQSSTELSCCHTSMRNTLSLFSQPVQTHQSYFQTC